MTKLKFTFSIFCFIAAISIYSCREEASSTSIPEVNIYLTDAPVDAEEVNVEILSIVIKGEETDEIELGTISGIYNLLDFQNDIDTLIASGNVTSIEQIKEVRMILGTENSIKIGGVLYPLTIPSGSESGLKLKVNLDLDDLNLVNLLIDFDACASVVETGNGSYHLKPVLKLKNKDNNEVNLSSTILDFISANYPNAEIEDTDLVMYCMDNLTQVEIKEDGNKTFLYFDANDQMIMSSVKIESSDLNTDVLNTIATSFVNAEAKDVHEVTLLNGDLNYWMEIKSDDKESEVIFDATGGIICEFNIEEEEEEEEEEDWDDLSQAVIDYIQSNYPGYELDDIDDFNFCGDQLIHVEIKDSDGNKVNLFFNQDDFVMTSEEIEYSDIPMSVTDGLGSSYPDYELEDDAYVLNTSSGNSQYLLEVETETQKLKVVLDENGSIICEFDIEEKEDNGNDPTLSQSVLDYINGNYPDAEIEKSSFVVFCLDTLLSVKMEEMDTIDFILYFDQMDNFVMSSDLINKNDVPENIDAEVELNYSEYNYNGRQEVLTDLNGNISYWLHMRDGNEEMELHLDAQGGFICSF